MIFMKALGLSFLLLAFFFVKCVCAQEILTDPISQYVDSIRLTHEEVDQIKSLRFSGYFQVQYQFADTAGINSYAGGNFAEDVNNRYMVRRGRLKASYSDKFAEYVIQFDGTEKGVGVRDAYLRLHENKWSVASLTAGMFDRPFGYEISYSSRLRESPERGRMSQILFPAERDLGAMISLEPFHGEKRELFKLDVGLFNGNGTSTSEFDSHKDLIVRLTLKNTKRNRIRLSGGLSYYYGKVDNMNAIVYADIIKLSNGDVAFVRDSSNFNLERKFDRQYYGANVQLNFFDFLGLTIIRAELITGQQVGTALGSTSPIVLQKNPLYIRPFNGAYFYFIQNILKTKHQIILKYDWYDPNTKVERTQIGKQFTNFDVGDIRFDTWGVGYIYRLNEHTRLMAYYDFVRNEQTSIIGENSTNNYRKDLKDNVFTTRLQYRF